LAVSRGWSTYREGSLHAALKALYARPGDRVEEIVDGLRVRLVRDDELVDDTNGELRVGGRKLRRLVEISA